MFRNSSVANIGLRLTADNLFAAASARSAFSSPCIYLARSKIIRNIGSTPLSLLQHSLTAPHRSSYKLPNLVLNNSCLTCSGGVPSKQYFIYRTKRPSAKMAKNCSKLCTNSSQPFAWQFVSLSYLCSQCKNTNDCQNGWQQMLNASSAANSA